MFTEFIQEATMTTKESSQGIQTIHKMDYPPKSCEDYFTPENFICPEEFCEDCSPEWCDEYEECEAQYKDDCFSRDCDKCFLKEQCGLE